MVRTLAVGILLAVALINTLPAFAEDGEPLGRCDRETVELPTSAAASAGTTFTGTYVGDTGGRALLSSWDLDRVYAGSPLPDDLSFATPECRWTNLTPGVRYLFSTAATDIAPSTRTPAQDLAANRR